jgi:hypothetical protein
MSVGGARSAAGLGWRDQRRQEGVLVIAQGLAGADIADQRPALRGPHGLPAGKAAPLLERSARPLRLIPRQGDASFANGLLTRMRQAGTIDAAVLGAAGRKFQRSFILAQLDPLRPVDLPRAPGSGREPEPGNVQLAACGIGTAGGPLWPCRPAGGVMQAPIMARHVVRDGTKHRSSSVGSVAKFPSGTSAGGSRRLRHTTPCGSAKLCNRAPRRLVDKAGAGA